MASGNKTDNHNLPAKLALRRRLLDRYHSDGRFSVFDCCQGSGLIWRTLRRDYECDYWGVDLKAARGRLVVDSVRVLECQGQVADVIDIDAYGSPWRHWGALLPNVVRPCTVFLTACDVKFQGVLRSTNETLESVGLLRFLGSGVPRGLLAKAVDRDAFRTEIAAASKHGLEVAAIVEALNPGGNARYFGVRLAPGRGGSGTP